MIVPYCTATVPVWFKTFVTVYTFFFVLPSVGAYVVGNVSWDASYEAIKLLGWGVQNLSIVNNGQLAHSNPFRESLLESTDVGKCRA